MIGCGTMFLFLILLPKVVDKRLALCCVVGCPKIVPFPRYTLHPFDDIVLETYQRSSSSSFRPFWDFYFLFFYCSRVTLGSLHSFILKNTLWVKWWMNILCGGTFVRVVAVASLPLGFIEFSGGWHKVFSSLIGLFSLLLSFCREGFLSCWGVRALRWCLLHCTSLSFNETKLFP